MALHVTAATHALDRHYTESQLLTSVTFWRTMTRRCAMLRTRATRASGRWSRSGECALSSGLTGTLLTDLRPIMRLSHARSRYIYDLYYKRELISRELYDWLLKQGYADAK